MPEEPEEPEVPEIPLVPEDPELPLVPDVPLDPDREQSEELEFSQKWGWTIHLYNICGSDLRMRNDWLNTEIIEFLNELSFLKEKHDIEHKPKNGKQY